MPIHPKDVANRLAGDVLARAGFSSVRSSTVKRTAWSWLQSRIGAPGASLLRGHGVVFTPSGRLELRPLDIAMPSAGEVTVLTAVSSISPGTERAQYLGLPNARVEVGHRPGFAVAGHVIAIGPDVHGVEVGDRVVALGVPHQSVVTVKAEQVLKVPAEVPLVRGSLLHAGVIAQHGVDRTGVRQGDDILVLGAGLIGGLAALFATHLGADVTIAASSRSKAAAYEGMPFRFATISELAGEFDHVIDVTGDGQALIVAAGLARDGGTIGLLGSPRAPAATVPLQVLRHQQTDLVGIHVSAVPIGTAEHSDTAQRVFEGLMTDRADQLMTLVADARGPDLVMRRVASDRTLVGAALDWRRIDVDDRASNVRPWTPPVDVTAQGADETAPPLPTPARTSATGGDTHRTPLRLGFVGCGEIAVATAGAALELDDVTVTAVTDPVRELANDISGSTGAEVAADLDDLLGRDDVDAVVLSVPHDLHRPLFERAVASGKHVVVEKPLANDLTAAVEMWRASLAVPGRVHVVSFPQRFEPNLLAASQACRSGALGRLRGASLLWLKEKPPSYAHGGYTGRTVSDWRQDASRAGGGLLIMNLCHYLDLVWFLTGENIVEVHARVDDPLGNGIEEGVSAVMTLEGGASLTVTASAMAPGAATEELRVWGENGHLVLGPNSRLLSLVPGDGRRTNRWHEMRGDTSLSARARLLRGLAMAIDGGPAPVDLLDGVRNQATITATYESARSGRPVRPVDLMPDDVAAAIQTHGVAL